MYTNSRYLIVLFAIFSSQAKAQIHHQTSGIVQAGYVVTDSQTSFLNKGTGTLRHDEDSIVLQQAIVQVDSTWTSGFSSTLILNAYTDGEQNIAPSQVQLKYQPIIKTEIKYKLRIGMFYPELSVENTDTGWLSPDTYTQSAINSWFGEELRIFGIEASLFKSGRRSASPWSWDTKIGFYKGNDPIGSIIAWRGFGMHDRQSLFKERVEFAAYPFVVSTEGINHPSWVEPFRELDGRVGGYLGVHLNYLRHTEFKYYRYDNFADPNAVNSQRLYAWRTKFHSLALNHRVNKNWQVKSQLLHGSTLMGNNFVHVDYIAGFLQSTYTLSATSKVTARIDVFDVSERDDIPEDVNTSFGHAITLNYQYKINQQWRIGSEIHLNRNTALNRGSLGVLPQQHEKQWLLIADYRF